MDFEFLPFFLFLASHGIHGRTNDYFSGSFDQNQNCLKEELMKNLTKESYPRCAAVIGGFTLFLRITKHLFYLPII